MNKENNSAMAVHLWASGLISMCWLLTRVPGGACAKGVGRIVFWAEWPSDLSKHLKAKDKKVLTPALWCGA
jgi:hypothetical protein